MRILLFGLSDFATRRLLPSFAVHPAVHSWALASRRDLDNARPHGADAVYRGFKEALDKDPAELVWISTENNLHFDLARLALGAGRHVIIDKPACMTASDCDTLIKESETRGLLVAEATVFSYHPQFEAALQIMKESGGISRCQILFCIPPLPSNNFRYNATRGGGCVNDMGPYFAAVCRFVLNGQRPMRLFGSIDRVDARSGVDVAFSAMAIGGDSCSIVGQFGFDGSYMNQIIMQGAGASVMLSRAFSPPPQQPLTLKIRRGNEPVDIVSGPADSVTAFVDSIADSIPRRDFVTFRQSMAYDMQIRASMLDHLIRDHAK